MALINYELGASVTGQLDDVTGEFIISGTGDMSNWSSFLDRPHDSVTSLIKTAIIQSGVTSIGQHTFTNCDNLTSVIIPTTVTNIFDSAFIGCISLTTVNLPNITSINASVFSGCSGLLSLTIPPTVTSIGAFAFTRCTSLSYIEIPDGVTFIDDFAFDGSGLITVDIADSVTYIGAFAFEETPLTSIKMPKDITDIKDGMFYGCYDLQSVIIPETVTSLGVYVFEDCTSLTSITIPKNVVSIGEDNFSGCINLSDIYFHTNGNIDLIDYDGVVNPTISTFNEESGLQAPHKIVHLYEANTNFITDATNAGYTIVYLHDVHMITDTGLKQVQEAYLITFNETTQQKELKTVEKIATITDTEIKYL